ncbi:MAG: hypothetical protein ABS43_20260 [Bordetella sp. SCN 67-23]|nr:RcnB family protein [Burkholderiales bacterium]ODS71677.1 MAG: hypothetical protein ABS43_20260 [Bordetella sp. SCN 67-23]ODU76549.1 MAG: hypothetical protein ABT00_15185 [Bordetella sp. SCN 68-11]OJW87389.1 MAG: hypothetical protein BGO71_28770 [Burkholderiales bacterium 67-32]
MIKKTLVIAMACAGLALGAAAQAKGDRWDRGHGHGHYDKHDRGDHRRWDDRRRDRDYRHGYHDGYRDAPRVVHRGWSPPPPHRWARGDRLPNYHRGGYYVVNDWHSRRLYRPQPGYQWVQMGSEYLLVAIASGVIASIILNN